MMLRCAAARRWLRTSSCAAARPGPQAGSASASTGVVSSNQVTAAGQTLSATALLKGENRGLPPGVQRLVDVYHTVPVERTRCFSIIAHIDHGKSTLADKLLESTRNIWPTTKGHQQVLDSLEVERSRGITVKAQSASMIYDRLPVAGAARVLGGAGGAPAAGVGASSLINAALAGQLDSRAGSSSSSGTGLITDPAAAAALVAPAAAPAPVPHLINLIDTPGHVDFSYEVSRSLAACQGALLLIDAGQGVQAQTVANYNAAREAGLNVIPVLTKIDLPTADPEPILSSLESLFGLDPETALWTSAKSGAGIGEVLPAIIDRMPPPAASNAVRTDRATRALLVDSWFDPYRGVVCSVLVAEGVLRPGDSITACHSGDRFTVQEVGLMAPAKVPVGTLSDVRWNRERERAEREREVLAQLGSGALAGGPAASAASGASGSPAASSGSSSSSCAGGLGAGQIGYVIAGMKSTKQALVGDTFVASYAPASPLAGFRPAKPVVFASLYPVDSGDFQALITAVDRLTLNDASVTVERESSSSLGFGLRCGFLGLLHMDVFHQRLQQEHETPVIITSPMVRYRLDMRDGSSVVCERAGDFPSSHLVDRYWEPTAHVSIMTPSIFVSPIMGLLAERRGVQEDISYLTGAGAAAAASSLASASGSSSAGAGEAAVLAAASSAGTAPSTTGGSGAAAEDEADADAEDDDEDHDDDDNDEDDADEDDDGDNARSSGSSSSSSSSKRSDSSTTGFTAAAAPEALGDRVVLKYRVPWSEVVTNLYDAIKSLSAGYASMDWAPGPEQEANIVRVDILLNGKPVDALCFVTHKDKCESEGRRVCEKLKKVIHRQQFEINIQAAVGVKVFAKERIPPFRKNVLEKNGKTMGGGDVTRKQKLLSAQREGKKRMKTVGNVELSQEAFHSLLTDK